MRQKHFLGCVAVAIAVAGCAGHSEPSDVSIDGEADHEESERLASAGEALTRIGESVSKAQADRLTRALEVAHGGYSASASAVAALVDEADSFSEALFLVRATYAAPNASAFLAEMSAGSGGASPALVYEYTAGAPAVEVQARLHARKEKRNRVLDAMSDAEFARYAKPLDAHLKALRRELAKRRGVAFDERPDSAVVIDQFGRVFRRKVTEGYDYSMRPRQGEPSPGNDDGYALIGVDNRQAITKVEGDSMTSAKRRAQIAFVGDAGPNPAGENASNGLFQPRCSGTKIGKRIVATAGHCLWSDSQWQQRDMIPGADGLALSELGADPSPSGYKNLYESYVRGPWHDHEWSNYDTGLAVMFDNKSTCDLGWYGWKEGVSNGWSVRVDGYPGYFQQCGWSPRADGLCGGSLYTDDGVITGHGAFRMYYDIDTTPGQSGSGVFGVWDGQRYIVGTHRGDNNFQSNDGVWYGNGAVDMINDAESDNPATCQ